MSGERFAVTIDISPWFHDHRFGGRTVLPAVESMLLLASRVGDLYPGIDVRVMEDGFFAKFLEIPDGVTELSVLVECAIGADDRIEARLLSRTRMKAMSRIKQHGEIFFSSARLDDFPVADIDPAPPADPVAEIKAERLYRDLVPFGPAYRTLHGTLYLSNHSGWGRLKSPDLPLSEAVCKVIGSPFPLDGALHAASVLGQQSVDFVPFPVGFERRIIFRPTQPGGCYIARVEQLEGIEEELIFDLFILDNEGLVYETVTGVRMRDVSGAVKR